MGLQVPFFFVRSIAISSLSLIFFVKRDVSVSVQYVSTSSLSALYAFRTQSLGQNLQFSVIQ